MKICILFTLVLNLHAEVRVTISTQGVEAVRIVTGYTPKKATLVTLDIVNNGPAINLASARIREGIINKEGYGILSSEIVLAVANILQQRDTFVKAQKALSAGSRSAVLLIALFKNWTPFTAGIISVAPEIAAAILPAVGDPRDLNNLANKIMKDNTVFALGSTDSGHDGLTLLIVVIGATAPIKSDLVILK